jgi:chemotaxis protein CheD
VDKNASMQEMFFWRRGNGFAGNRETAPTKLPEVYLHPGQNHVATNPAILKMILGSCAGVFFFDAVLAIGAATHFMLPRHGAGVPSPRYGDVAIAELLAKLRALGSRHIEAKVFGGASMLSALRGLPGNGFGQIGQKNVEISLELLAQEGIPITDKNVFGDRGRKVAMASHTGEITLDFVKAAHGDR